MVAAQRDFELRARPIRDLGLQIGGTRLEVLIAELERELSSAGITRVHPKFYLSTEWGVPMNTIAIAIPFYLANADLTRLHLERTGLVEGIDDEDILRYLRHEAGHVLNYAYRLYDRDDWVRSFGPITRPYIEEYRPEPFSPRFVRHLPGWYAQKHPDEDWAETFAVWLTPKLEWRAEYRDQPLALAKIELCDRIISDVRDRDPLVSSTDLDEDVQDLSASIDEYYRGLVEIEATLPPGIAGAIGAIFDTVPATDGAQRAAEFMKTIEWQLVRNVYRWTGHFPERTRVLLRALEREADRLNLVVRRGLETEAAIAFTSFVTSLAMNYVVRGSYLPTPPTVSTE